MLLWKRKSSYLLSCCLLLLGCSDDLIDALELSAKGVAEQLKQEQAALDQQDELEEGDETKTIEQEELALENGTLSEETLEEDIEAEEVEIEKCILERGLKKMSFSITNRRGASQCNSREKIILRIFLRKIRKHVCSSENDVENGQIKSRKKLQKNLLKRLLKRIKKVKDKRDKKKPGIPRRMPPPNGMMPESGDMMPPPDDMMPESDDMMPPSMSNKNNGRGKRVAKICSLLDDLLQGRRRKYFEQVEHQDMSPITDEGSTQDSDGEDSDQNDGDEGTTTSPN